jgi:hypothetical protein
MDYPSSFGGWHSVISSGHLLIVLSLIFFLLMLLDSFYENRAVSARFRGVSRLNTRLSFYTYEVRKLRYWQGRALPLQRGLGVGVSQTYLFCFWSEVSVSEYVFRRPSSSDASATPWFVPQHHSSGTISLSAAVGGSRGVGPLGVFFKPSRPRFYHISRVIATAWSARPLRSRQGLTGAPVYLVSTVLAVCTWAARTVLLELRRN